MPRGEHRPSILLSRDENEQVFALIGPKCLSLASAVIQLFTTEGPGHSEWKKKDTGVLCLIKDSAKRSYFFRIYCLCRKAMIWEHEVYLEIEYKSPRPYLHTFEAEEYMTAFNFANEDEARSLRNILFEKIELRKQKREDRRQRSLLASQANRAPLVAPARHNGAAPLAAPPPAPLAALPTHPTLKPANSLSSNYASKSKKPKTRKLTKADIGSPQNFKHVSHVGLDPNKCFDVDIPEEDMRSFFSMAGVSDMQLQDHATRSFIYEFIQTHGGVDAVKEELIDKPVQQPARVPPPAPPVPARCPAPPLPPAPPSRAPPPPPARTGPPPAPPVPPAPRRDPPPPRPSQPPSSAPPPVPPPPPPGTAPPPPPPPPPAPDTAPPAPPPPPAPAPDLAPDPRALLFESIRNGNKNLKHVEVASSRSSLNEDNRSNLLSEIRQGIELRSVSKTAGQSGAVGTNTGRSSPCGLAGALARALQERSRVIHSSDSELSDETSDGEWDD